MGTKTARRWLAGFALAALAAGGTTVLVLQRQARAAVQVYDVTFKGLIKALDGTKVPFIATGTGTVDVATGEFSYDVVVPELEQAIDGTGTLATGLKGSYGLSSFDSGSWQGTAIILGKFNKDTSRFKGKITIAIPNHFGPAPNGFTHTTGTILLVRQEAPL
jgi:hypothetical protein